jgi:O-antigen/teichoic acid export membrane protein
MDAVSATHAAAPRALARSADSLLVSTAISAALGFVFWIVAARVFAAEDLGRDAVLIGAMLELSTICQLNLDNVMARQLPAVRDRAARFVGAAYGLNVLMAAVLGGAFVLIAPAVADDLAFLQDEPLIGIAFVVGLALWGIFTLQDAALTATRHAHWVPVENAIFGVVKLAALPVAFLLSPVHGVLLAWTVPMALLLVPVNLLVFRRVLVRHRAVAAVPEGHPAPLGRRTLGVLFAQDYLGQVLMRLAVTIIPVLVVATLGTAANAYFFVPFTIVIAFDMMILSVGTSLLAEGAHDTRLVRAHVRTVIRRYGPLVLAGVLVLVVAAPLVLAPFGADYARESADVLRLMALASLPRAVVFLAGAVWRLQAHGRWLFGIEALMLVLLLGSLVPLADGMGLPGVGLAWLGAAGAGGIVAALWLWPFLRHEDR